MMSWRTTILFLLLLALASGTLSQQTRKQPVTLRESPYFDGEITFSTPDGPRTVRVAIKQFQLDGGAEAEMPLPDSGMVVLQHRAGHVKLTAARTDFEPLEGEWMTIDLPEGVTLATEDDAALIDAIVVSE